MMMVGKTLGDEQFNEVSPMSFDGIILRQSYTTRQYVYLCNIITTIMLHCACIYNIIKCYGEVILK